MSFWSGRSVLVTGGTGSLGQALVARFMDMPTGDRPRRIAVLSRDELKQSEMRARWPARDDEPPRYFIADVRDVERLRIAFRGVDTIIHGAALKQVPTCEYNPFEAVKTNVVGSQNVAQAAIDCGVERAMLVSTDKCVDPHTLYGATKMVAERLFLGAAAYVGQGQDTTFAAVRYGNVVGSRGSVLRLWQEQRHAGPGITVTDPSATRFWITLRQAVDFVLSSVERMHGGEVFIPKLRATTVGEAASCYAPEKDWSLIGLRPSEKKHELLIHGDEGPLADFSDRYVIGRPIGIVKKKMAFHYSSETAPHMARHELVQLLQNERLLP